MKPRVLANLLGTGWLVTYLEDGVTRASWAATWEVALHRANRLAWKQGRGD